MNEAPRWELLGKAKVWTEVLYAALRCRLASPATDWRVADAPDQVMTLYPARRTTSRYIRWTPNPQGLESNTPHDRADTGMGLFRNSIAGEGDMGKQAACVTVCRTYINIVCVCVVHFAISNGDIAFNFGRVQPFFCLLTTSRMIALTVLIARKMAFCSDIPELSHFLSPYSCWLFG